jgi:hypothetical protein
MAGSIMAARRSMKWLARSWPLGVVVIVTLAWWVLAMWLTQPAPKESLLDKTLIESQVRRVLPNPSSARFRLVKYFEGSKVGCGEVLVLTETGTQVKVFFVAHEHGHVRLSSEMPANDFLKVLEESCPDPELQALARKPASGK